MQRYLFEQVPVQSLCHQHGLHPNVWQKEFFEGGAAAFKRDGSREVKQLKPQISDFEDRLARM